LNGYESKDDVPDYRILKVQSYGNFIGIGWSQMRNMPIAPSSLPQEYREFITTTYSMDAVSYQMSLLSGGEADSNFQESWPADWIAYFGDKIIENMTCVKAWKLIPRPYVASIIDTVRTRILSFILEIEAIAPDAGEALPNEKSIPVDKVGQIFHTHIYGNVASLAQGGQVTTYDVDITVIQNDLQTLKEYLASLGIDEEDIDELDEAIREDAKSPAESGLGSKVRGWLGKMIGKSGTAAWNVGISVAATLLEKALSRYYGLDS
jgi:hypothetical protein